MRLGSPWVLKVISFGTIYGITPNIWQTEVSILQHKVKRVRLQMENDSLGISCVVAFSQWSSNPNIKTFCNGDQNSDAMCQKSHDCFLRTCLPAIFIIPGIEITPERTPLWHSSKALQDISRKFSRTAYWSGSVWIGCFEEW